MGNIFSSFILWLFIIILIALWGYLFIYSYRHKAELPWGFSFVIVGLLVSGIGYHFYKNLVVVFSLNLSLAVCLIGMLWNINNIRKQFQVGNRRELLRSVEIGLLSGVMFGLFIVITQGTKYIQVNSQFTITALIVSSIQSSMAEEFLFRGYFLNYLRKYEFNQFFSIGFQALTFAVLHISRYSGNWMVIFTILLVGVMAGYLTWKNNNLISAFILHVVANLIAVIWWLAAA